MTRPNSQLAELRTSLALSSAHHSRVDRFGVGAVAILFAASGSDAARDVAAAGTVTPGMEERCQRCIKPEKPIPHAAEGEHGKRQDTLSTYETNLPPEQPVLTRLQNPSVPGGSQKMSLQHWMSEEVPVRGH